MPPFIIINGPIDDPDNNFIMAGENEILAEAEGILEAVEVLLMMYYVCNIQYPKECFNTYIFLQRSVLKVFDNQKLHTKVLLLLSELANL